MTRVAHAQDPVVANTLVFDNGAQILKQDLDANNAPIPNSLISLASAPSPQQAQEPQWSLAASPLDGGRIVYQFGASGVRGVHIVKPDGTGDVQLTPPPSSGYVCTDARDPSWSPDGRFIAYACLVAPLNNYDIWIHDTAGTPDNPSDDSDYPLLTLPSQELHPAWSPDNTMIAFVTSAPGRVGVGPTSKIAVVQITTVNGNVQPLVGTNGVLLTDDTFNNFSPTWSPDGQLIAFSTTRSGGHDIYRMSARYGEGDPSTFFRLTTSTANDTNPAWSPDGRTIAFASDRSGSSQIWIMSAVAGDTDTFDLHQITNDSANDNDPAWTPNSVAPSSSLTLIVPGVVVTSGVSRPTGSGTVTVTDGFGHIVSGAFVTIVAPQTTVMGTGALAFGLPSPPITDSNGQLAFTAMESGAETNTADYQFAVAAWDAMTGKSDTTTATIRVFASGGIIPPQPPGPIPVPNEMRLPIGQAPFTAAQKQQFAQDAAELSKELEKKVQFETGLEIVHQGVDIVGLSPQFSQLHSYLEAAEPASFAWTLAHVAEVELKYFYILDFMVLANDPPDPNFATLALPQVKSPPTIAIGGGPLSPNSVSLFNQSLAIKAITKAYLDALTTSINRYSSAINAGDLASASLQRNAILAYEDTLALLFQKDASVSQQLLATLQQAGVPDVQLGVSDVVALQSAVATNGLPSEMTQILGQLGLTATDIQAIQSSFVNAPPASITGSFLSSLQADATTAQAAFITFAQASPAVPPATPVITVTGGTFAFDGSAHGASATATGVSGTAVSGSFTFTYTPGGTSPPVNVGTYTVTAQFTSNDPNYTNASDTGTITIVPAIPTQTVSSTGSMQFARASHQATLLADGLVLVSGGQNGGTAVAQSELYTPATGKWSLTGSNVIPRFDHAATLLLDGRVLATGGVSFAGDCSSNVTAETYDPASGTWSLTGRIPSPVGTGHIAIRLLDGRVLVAGGGDRCGAVFNTASIFDPSSNKWSATGSMTAAREFHSAALLPDGRVLVAGGVAGSPFPAVATAEIYDPATGQWTPVASMGTAREASCNGYAQTYLANLSGGGVLAAGGFSGPNCYAITPQRTVVGLTVNPGAVQLSAVRQTQALAVTAQMSDGSTQPFTGPLQFGSADTTVANVDSNGLITSVGAGTTNITATASGIAPVSVTTTVASRRLTAISVSPALMTAIGPGQTQLLAVNGQFSDGSQQALTSGVTFVSSNTAVASVDQTGLVTSGANGTATITVSTQGAPAVQVPVLVKSVVSIGVSPASITLNALGQTQFLSVTGQFSDGSQQTLTSAVSFISSAPSVARVDLNGVVTAINIGTATITVALPNVAAVQVPVTVTIGPPALVSVSPSSSQAGRPNLSVSLAGQFTHWVQGTTVADFGPGINVASLAVSSPTSATAVLTIDPAAASGPRTVTLATGSEVVSLVAGFTVSGAPTEADAKSFSVLNLAGVTGGQPIALEADTVLFSVLTTSGAGGTGGSQSSEVDAADFSVLNLAGVTGGNPAPVESDAVPFSVLNTAGPGGSGGSLTLFEVDGLVFSGLNLAGVSGNQPVQMEVDGVTFSVQNGAGPVAQAVPSNSAPQKQTTQAKATTKDAGTSGSTTKDSDGTNTTSSIDRDGQQNRQ